MRFATTNFVRNQVAEVISWKTGLYKRFQSKYSTKFYPYSIQSSTRNWKMKSKPKNGSREATKPLAVLLSDGWSGIRAKLTTVKLLCTSSSWPSRRTIDQCQTLMHYPQSFSVAHTSFTSSPSRNGRTKQLQDLHSPQNLKCGIHTTHADNTKIYVIFEFWSGSVGSDGVLSGELDAKIEFASSREIAGSEHVPGPDLDSTHNLGLS